MSNTLLKLKIDLLKVKGAKIINAKDGIEYLAIPIKTSGMFYAGKGCYLDLDMRENKNGGDQYENTHMLTISPTKDQREAKERTPIVGNAKTLVFGSNNQPKLLDNSGKLRHHSEVIVANSDDDDSEIPF
jgi:hypothetical protein